jgi:hypothetical protein
MEFLEKLGGGDATSSPREMPAAAIPTIASEASSSRALSASCFNLPASPVQRGTGLPLL